MGKKSKRRQAKKNKKASSGDTSKQVSIGQDNINSKCKHECFEYLLGLVFDLTDYDIAKVVL